MHKILFFLILLISPFITKGEAESEPDTVIVGVYVNSIHDIDFKEKQYTISMWLWLKYKNPDFDFSKYLEIPMAKAVDKSFYTVDTLEDGRIYMLMKLQCIMKDNWKIDNFPFDHQKLRFSIENSQYGAEDLVFAEDTLGKHYSKWTISGWNVVPDSFKIKTSIKKYATAFGDPAAMKPQSEFSVFRMQIGLERNSWWLFLKLFIGMYISFLLAFLSFFVHHNSIDSRFTLNVGSLFAVVGNKYVIDSALPESTTFTLVDSLHGLTMFCIFVAVACSTYALTLVKMDKTDKILEFDRKSAFLLFILYAGINIWLIHSAQ